MTPFSCRQKVRARGCSALPQQTFLLEFFSAFVQRSLQVVKSCLLELLLTMP